MNYILTMTLDEIYALEHVTVTEDEHYVYVTPETGYYLLVKDYPEDKKYYDTIQMLKQDRYVDITVKSMYDPSILGLDGSVSNTSVIDSSALNDTLDCSIDPSLFDNTTPNVTFI